MPASPSNASETFQAQFHQRWNHLNDPHVRDLAWLLDAPDLLDPGALQWHDQIATLAGHAANDAAIWLAELDAAPASLHAYLDLHASSRLGRYAERLMAFYFGHMGTLVAHGLQVRASKNDTVGEFDFLLRKGAALLHWEFATKFYLLHDGDSGLDSDYFVGPNLADTLGAKMRKILARQLKLGQHPAAQMYLPQPLDAAQALIKGWLFYPCHDPSPVLSMGLADAHCRGFWCTLAEIDDVAGEQFVVLPRLRWLAPAKISAGLGLGRLELQQALRQHFAQDSMPVLVAVMERQGECLLEISRGFIVPDRWRHEACKFQQDRM